MQQFRADSGTGFVTATMAAVGCSMQFVLPNRTPLPATREAGLVQIANALAEIFHHKISGIWLLAVDATQKLPLAAANGVGRNAGILRCAENDSV